MCSLAALSVAVPSFLLFEMTITVQATLLFGLHGTSTGGLQYSNCTGLHDIIANDTLLDMTDVGSERVMNEDHDNSSINNHNKRNTNNSNSNNEKAATVHTNSDRNENNLPSNIKNSHIPRNSDVSHVHREAANRTSKREVQNIPSNVIDHIDEETACQDLLTSTAYKEGVCGVSDVESYIKSRTSEFTCEKRCGQQPNYSGPGTRNCNCDELCVIHHDCCQDMSKVCPDMYYSSKIVYFHLAGAQAGCTETDFSEIFNKKTIVSDTHTPLPSTSTVTYDYSLISTVTLPYKNRVEENGLVGFSSGFGPLKDYIPGLLHFRVADDTFGLIFSNLPTFSDWRVSISRPFFIPKIVTLIHVGGSAAVLKDLKHAESNRVLPMFSLYSIRDVRTSFHRACRTLEFISCHCKLNDGEIEVVSDFRHDTCLGKHNAKSLFKRYEALREFQALKRVTRFKQHEQCSVSKINFATSANTDPLTSLDLTLEMTVTPVFKLHEEATEDGNVDQNGRDRKLQSSVTEKDVEFVVEFKNFIERRFRCPSSKSYLTECRIEKCAEEAVLAFDFSMSAHYGGGICILPVSADVLGHQFEYQVPWCICFRAFLALSEIWQVTIDRKREGRCFLFLRQGPESK